MEVEIVDETYQVDQGCTSGLAVSLIGLLVAATPGMKRSGWRDEPIRKGASGRPTCQLVGGESSLQALSWPPRKHQVYQGPATITTIFKNSCRQTKSGTTACDSTETSLILTRAFFEEVKAS